MKKNVIVFFLLIIPVFLFADSQVRGFSKGVSKAEVKAEEWSKLVEEDTEDGYTFLGYEDEIFSLPCEVAYVFEQDKLMIVMISFIGDPDDISERFPVSEFEEFDLLDYMRSKYGPESCYLSESSEYSWFLPDMNIRLYVEIDGYYEPEIESIDIGYIFKQDITPSEIDSKKF